MNEDIVKIPKERVAVLIGVKGQDKRMLQQKTHCKLTIDTEEGDVTISGEAVDVFNTIPIIKAIGRGFNPKVALKLLNEDQAFKLIEIKDFIGRNKNALARVKSRIIGTEGTARKAIEEYTNTNIIVYGKTVGIIGEMEDAEIAAEAVENILRGARHGNVYAWIQEKNKKRMREAYEQRKR